MPWEANSESLSFPCEGLRLVAMLVVFKTGSGSCFSQGNGVICGFSAFGCAASTGSRATSADGLFTSTVLVNYASERSAPNDCCELLFPSTKCGDKSLRTRRELATAPAWALSRGIEMVKTDNR